MDAAEGGQSFTVTRDGRPIGELVHCLTQAIRPVRRVRGAVAQRAGDLAGRVSSGRGAFAVRCAIIG
jgi:hypothetical protein